MNNALSSGNGRIELILGPMFAGKSSELIRRVDNYKLAQNDHCSFIKYDKDNRWIIPDISTHDGTRRPAIPSRNLKDFNPEQENKINVSKVIGIDEGQFFEYLVEFCIENVKKGKIIIVAALNGTFNKDPWKVITELIPHVDEIVFLTAFCSECKVEQAPFTRRLCENNEIELIGGSKEYQALCRICYEKHSIK